MTPNSLRRTVIVLASITMLAVAVVELQVIRGASDPAVNQVLPAAGFSAAVILAVAFGVPALVRRFELDLAPWVPWLIGGLSAIAAFVPWLLLVRDLPAWAEAWYRGFGVPQGIEKFWDVSLVLRSVDCARFGFDVYAANNGCLRDPSIYGPGSLWLQYVPFKAFSHQNVGVIGVVMIAASSLALAWLARLSTGRGRLVLLVAAVAAPWQLLLERGNFDAFVIWAAVLLVFLVRRWDALWTWAIGAGVIWLVGTWKYYPFALGLMLIPVLRLRRGWLVLVGFAVATASYVILTWDNLLFSLDSNGNMPVAEDVAILGRVPLVARMLGGDTDPATYQADDLLVGVVALSAFAWGAAFGFLLSRLRQAEAMLALGGSALFLSSVLVSGFGYAYKAAFLLLAVPFFSRPLRAATRIAAYSTLVMLVLVLIASVVVGNTALATVAGVVAASFGVGASLMVLGRLLVEGRRVHASAGAARP